MAETKFKCLRRAPHGTTQLYQHDILLHSSILFALFVCSCKSSKDQRSLLRRQRPPSPLKAAAGRHSAHRAARPQPPLPACWARLCSRQGPPRRAPLSHSLRSKRVREGRQKRAGPRAPPARASALTCGGKLTFARARVLHFASRALARPESEGHQTRASRAGKGHRGT